MCYDSVFKLHWMLLITVFVNLSGDLGNVSVMDWTQWNTRVKTNGKCLPQKQFSVYCISDQHVCMTHRFWQQPHRHTPLQVVHNNKGTPRIGRSQLVHYNQMFRSKTACHAAIWHGKIRLDEIHFKVQEVSRLAYSSIHSATHKYNARGGVLRHERWHTCRMICFWRMLPHFFIFILQSIENQDFIIQYFYIVILQKCLNLLTLFRGPLKFSFHEPEIFDKIEKYGYIFMNECWSNKWIDRLIYVYTVYLD